MKKEYTSPQFDYWCYIGGKLCQLPDVPIGETVYGETPTQQFLKSSPQN